MNKPKAVISGIGHRGEKIINTLYHQSLLEIDYLNYNQLVKNFQINTSIIFIVYSPKDYCIEMIDEIVNLHKKKTIIEIIITDRIERRNPHYLINNFSSPIEDISTLIKAFIDLGRFPSQASIDMADITDSIKNAGKLQMKEFKFEEKNIYDTFNKEFLYIITTKKITTIWLQIYLQKRSDLLYKVLEESIDAINVSEDDEIDFLWNVSFEDPVMEYEENKCVLVYC